MSTPCLLTPHAYSSSTCGYCSPSGSRSKRSSSKKYGMEASQMSVQFYQDLIDRGWRRSGDYVYRPDMARTCCPQYTIRLDSTQFKPNKKHRQVMNRFNRFLETGEKPGESSTSTDSNPPTATPKGAPKGKGKVGSKGKGKEGSWLDTLRECQFGYSGNDEGSYKHKFETELVPAKATTEIFELYKTYQVAVHNDKPEKVGMRGFSRFLCDSPLGDQIIHYTTRKAGLPDHYGSYHLLYKVDKEIIGISVIDIIPNCISSVYFIWHPSWAWASLGKLSALHEIALSVEMREAGLEKMKYLYMGYWISDCIKMRYKSEFSPSFLLDPGTLDFHPLTAELDKYLQSHSTGYHPFATIMKGDQDMDHPKQTKNHPIPPEEGEDGDSQSEADSESEFEDEDDFPSIPPPGFGDPTSYTQNQLDKLVVLMKQGGKTRVVPLGALQFVNQESMMSMIRELVSAVGLDLMADGSALSGMRDKGILYFG